MYSCAVSFTGSPALVTLPERVSRRMSPAIELGRGVARRAADQRAQASDQFLGLERLGEIIVGAGIEAGDLVRPAVARGQHQHRHLAPFLAPAVEHGQAVDLGQAEIEDHRVIAFGRAEIMAVLAVGGEVDGIAGAFERRAQLAPEIGFVFDDQNAHSCPPNVHSRQTHAKLNGCLSGTNWGRRRNVNRCQKKRLSG